MGKGMNTLTITCPCHATLPLRLPRRADFAKRVKLAQRHGWMCVGVDGWRCPACKAAKAVQHG